jgi:hypothetical protein
MYLRFTGLIFASLALGSCGSLSGGDGTLPAGNYDVSISGSALGVKVASNSQSRCISESTDPALVAVMLVRPSLSENLDCRTPDIKRDGTTITGKAICPPSSQGGSVVTLVFSGTVGKDRIDGDYSIEFDASKKVSAKERAEQRLVEDTIDNLSFSAVHTGKCGTSKLSSSSRSKPSAASVKMSDSDPVAEPVD